MSSSPSRPALRDWLFASSSTSPPSMLLMDGGVSTHLQELHPTFSHRALWSSSLLLDEAGRRAIVQGHQDWLRVGVDIVTTVTYQCHFQGVVPGISNAQMETMMQQGVQLALEAAQGSEKGYYVVVSSGCYGASLADGSEYTGNYDPEADLYDFHKRKTQVFLRQHPHGLAVETIPNIQEVRVVCQVLKDLLLSADTSASSTEKPAVACWISLCCQDGHRLNDGTPLTDALETIRQMDPNADAVHAIGINCCDSAHIGALLETIAVDMASKGPRRGIVVYPNSGEEWDATSEDWKAGTGCHSSEDFSGRLMEGVRLVRDAWEKHHDGSEPMPKMILGGCCRTSPATIATLRRKIDEWA